MNRANNLLSMFNHGMIKGGEKLYGKVKNITISTIIIHGTEDCVLPYAHAIELNKTIPDSVLVPIDGAGHEIHHQDWELIINAIYRFINE